MSLVKRKRGRPRLDESHEYNEFDLNLIQEFRKNPVLYDRTHPEHRNKDYTDRIWSRIANNVNDSLNHVKSRIVQLRNRYNVEKRRLEALQEHQRDLSLTSQWSLYKYLTFLNDYTKARRPYSLPRISAVHSLSDVDENANGNSKTVGNGAIESPDELTNSQQHYESTCGQIPNDSVSSILLPSTPLQNSTPVETKQSITQKKYRDFGKFLASSLIEMNERLALNLVNKFTNELVKSLKASKYKNNFNGQYNSYVDEGGDDDSSSSKMDSD